MNKLLLVRVLATGQPVAAQLEVPPAESVAPQQFGTICLAGGQTKTLINNKQQVLTPPKAFLETFKAFSISSLITNEHIANMFKTV